MIAAVWAAPVIAQDTIYNEGYQVDAEPLWYMQTPVWIGAAVIVFLLLIALFRGRKKTISKKEELVNSNFTVKKIKQNHPNI